MNDDDLAIIDLLCRCQLAARRLGCRIVIHDATDCVRQAVSAGGLARVLLDDDARDGPELNELDAPHPAVGNERSAQHTTSETTRVTTVPLERPDCSR